MFNKIITFLETAPLIGKIFTFLFSIWLVCKKDFRLIQNLKRPIMVIGSSGKDMSLIVSLIRDAGFFRVEEPSQTAQNIDRIKQHSLVVVAYTKTESETEKIINAVRTKSIPVIFYAAPSEIDRDDGKLIQEYSYAEIANSPFRLMNLIFSILSTYNYDR